MAVVLAASGMARGYGSTGGVPGEPGGGTSPPASDSAQAPAAPAARAARRGDVSSGDSLALPAVPPIEPTGVETVTAADLALLASEVAMPLDGIEASSLRSNYDEARGGGTREHRALDIMAPRGTPVRSVAKGRVLKLFTSVAGGLMVYAADSSERFILMYAHLDGYAPGLREGAALARGQVIGTVGSTGNASPSAPHLHFAIARSADVTAWSKGMPIDPLPVLQAAGRRR
ncbi:MAG: M23 family metallopeptidase [Gemmatimonadaceae bacterium]|nr:M23 family metallopeptidase [Gemmatimonadaceae bacterium]